MPIAARGTLPLLAAAAALLTALSGVPAAAAEPPRVDVPGATPAWTAAATDLGAAPGASRVQAQIGLDLPDEAGAVAFATAVSTPGDPRYRRPLTPAAWIARFAPTEQQVADVRTAVTAAGLAVDAVPRSRLFVLVSGDAAAMGAFFRTRLHAYAVDGMRRIAPVGGLSLPRVAGRHVGAVVFDHPPVTGRSVRPAASTSSSSCSTHWKQHEVTIPKAYGARTASTLLCGATAKQLRALSGIDPARDGDGRGQTIAVIDAFGSPTMRADLASYSKANRLRAAAYTEHVPDRSTWRTSAGCSPEEWAAEQAMDLEAAHAIAPRARLVYVGAADCGFGFDVAMSAVLDERLATIVSNSWGSTGLDALVASGRAGTEGVLVNLHQHLQAAGEGIGLYFASGDDGDEKALLEKRAVDFPASSPWVTAVGGTSEALDRRGRTAFRTAWGRSITIGRGSKWRTKPPGRFVQGAGGGASRLFARPAYQSLVPGTALAHGTRAVPDVAALASPETGMAVGMRVDGRYRVLVAGGTSLATPIVAAQAALAQQRAGRALGFLNPALYRAAAKGAVVDVRPSSVRRVVAARAGADVALVTLDRDSSLKVRRRYDLATGVGELGPAARRALAR